MDTGRLYFLNSCLNTKYAETARSLAAQCVGAKSHVKCINVSHHLLNLNVKFHEDCIDSFCLLILIRVVRAVAKCLVLFVMMLK